MLNETTPVVNWAGTPLRPLIFALSDTCCVSVLVISLACGRYWLAASRRTPCDEGQTWRLHS